MPKSFYAEPTVGSSSGKGKGKAKASAEMAVATVSETMDVLFPFLKHPIQLLAEMRWEYLLLMTVLSWAAYTQLVWEVRRGFHSRLLISVLAALAALVCLIRIAARALTTRVRRAAAGFLCGAVAVVAVWYGPCWRMALTNNVAPFRIAHYQGTFSEWAHRGNVSVFGNFRPTSIWEEREQQNNVCSNTGFAAIYKAMQAVRGKPLSQPRVRGLRLSEARPDYIATTTYLSIDALPYVREWVEFHMFVGIDHMYIYESIDPKLMSQKLADYISGGQVTVLDHTKPNIKLFGGPQIAQMQHSIHTNAHKSWWLAHIDSDEFLAPTDWQTPGALKRDLVRLQELGYCEVQVPRQRFGSNGLTKRPPLSTMAYTRSSTADYVKSIIWTPALSMTTGFPHCFAIRNDHCVGCRRLWWGILDEWATDNMDPCECADPAPHDPKNTAQNNPTTNKVLFDPTAFDYRPRPPPFMTWSWIKSWIDWLKGNKTNDDDKNA